MARKDRNGKRISRENRTPRRFTKLGYYLIVTDTEATERCYFNGLHNSLNDKVKDKLVIKVVETKTHNLIDKCLELMAYEAQHRTGWIVFDRDQVKDFDEIIKKAEKADINVGWSNPCFEIWLHAYFGSMPSIKESWACCSKFGDIYEKKTGQKYSKADSDLYDKLIRYGDEKKALQIAENRLEAHLENGSNIPSKMYPASNVYKLVREIKDKANMA